MSLYRYAAENANKRKELEQTRRSTNTLKPQKSAFDRIFSSKNMMTKTIPNFLVQPKPKIGLNHLDLLRINLSSKPKIEEPPIIDLTESVLELKIEANPNDRLKINSEKLADIRKIEKIMSEIFNPTLPGEELILNFNKRKLTRKDLICFKEGSDLPGCVVDCYMSIIKIANKLVSKQQVAERIIIVNSQHSNLLFSSRKEIPRPKNDIFEYDAMIFPIFDGYWTLIYVNLKNGVMKYYDPFVQNKEINGMVVMVKRFLIQANSRNDPNINENFVKYEPNKIIPTCMSLKDSGVYVCKVAEGIAQHRESTQFNFHNFRKDMLATLIKISLKVSV